MTEQEKQKQIEEIANWLKSAITDTLHDCPTDCECCNNKYKNFGMADCLAMSEAEYLFNAGYGDTKQAVREFAENVRQLILKNTTPTFNLNAEPIIQIDTLFFYDKLYELVKEICGA